MDFYVLKKQQKLIAIPADVQNCKQYINSGYLYIDKVAACNETNALQVLQAKKAKAVSNKAVVKNEKILTKEETSSAVSLKEDSEVAPEKPKKAKVKASAKAKTAAA